MYLVQLCDGNRMYILGANLLSQLEGTYLILDELVIESPAQEFDVVVTQRRPLFAMKFEEYEPNGNIKELRWKITNRAPKYYTYSYDALNRVTGAPYGFLYRSPSQGILAVQSNQYAAPSFGYDAVGNITIILPSGTRSGFCLFLFAPCCVENAPRSYGYACAFRLAGHKNKIAKISPLMPEGSISNAWAW
ncbi:MAG: hypothetical protein H6559_03585 [Lewinellaceae bacterium]|nr:hypothetical protein [Lewinellaceae bacterium]